MKIVRNGQMLHHSTFLKGLGPRIFFVLPVVPNIYQKCNKVSFINVSVM